jgi:hypothetical protein
LSSEPYGQNLEAEDDDDEEPDGQSPSRERVLSDGLLQTYTDHEVGFIKSLNVPVSGTGSSMEYEKVGSWHLPIFFFAWNKVQQLTSAYVQFCLTEVQSTNLRMLFLLF